MSKILIFKTSVDATMKRLLQELGKENDIDCLIQSNQVQRYRTEYPYINFIDIRQEAFYDIPVEIISAISKKKYEQLYVTFSGIVGHNYGNVMSLVNRVHFEKGCFYNCNGDRMEIPPKNFLKDMVLRIYIRCVEFMLRD